jgi:hypothetical protein
MPFSLRTLDGAEHAIAARHSSWRAPVLCKSVRVFASTMVAFAMNERVGDCKPLPVMRRASFAASAQAFRSIALSRFCNGGSTAFFNSATVFSRSPTRL